MIDYPEAAKLSCEDCVKYERVGFRLKADEEGNYIPRENPVECAYTGPIDSQNKLSCWGCPNEKRPAEPLSPEDERFLLMNRLCKDFGWSYEDAKLVPASFIQRWSVYDQIIQIEKANRQSKLENKMNKPVRTKSFPV